MANELAKDYLRPEHGPSVDQLEEYRDLMTAIVRATHRGVKVTPRFPGTEFLLPGSFTQWSEPDAEGHLHIERDRTYSASYKQLGEGAHKLIVLESDSVLMAHQKRYATNRRVFRFGWQDDVVYDSQALYTEIISDAPSIIDIAAAGERTIGISELEEHCDPFRYSEHMLTDKTGVECLMHRTERYSRAYLAYLNDDYHDELAS